MIVKLVKFGLVAAIVGGVVLALPDLKRYLKMKAM
jgi:hypothetical protein